MATAASRRPPHPPIIVVMGASGAGKTTVGRALSVALGWEFIEADELHPPANVAKMQSGAGLTDRDRRPWLLAVRGAIEDAVREGQPVVVACSALKQAYRERLAEGLGNVRFVYLKANPPLLRQRVASRGGHFAGPALVETQMGDLEEPDAGALTLEAAAPPETLVTAIRRAWQL